MTVTQHIIGICGFVLFGAYLVIFSAFRSALTRRGRVRSKHLLSGASPLDKCVGLEGKPGVARRKKKIPCPHCDDGAVGPCLTDPCGVCHGTGYLKAPRNISGQPRLAETAKEE